MNTDYLVPHQRAIHEAGIRMLLLTQFIVLMPFFVYMPNWLWIVFVVVVFWRLRVLRGELRKPPRSLLLLALVTGIGGLLLSGLQSYSLDTAVAFCLLGYLLKSLEVLRRRDAIFQIYLGFFLTGVYLLYRFDPLGALVMVLLLICNVLALQTVTADSFFNLRYALRSSLLLVLMAIPVMVIGYLFFPRLPPLWHIPNDHRGTVTGMSDELDFGSVSNLAQSRASAFRVRFDGAMPPRDQWYWRGLTLSQFDGRTWRVPAGYQRGLRAQQRNLPQPADDAAVYSYNIVSENTGRRWLYFLDWPVSISGDGLEFYADARAASISPLTSAFRYYGQSSSVVTWGDGEPLRSQNLQLPVRGNELLRQWSQQRRAEQRSDSDFVRWLLQYIRTEPFAYTLSPPLYQSSDNIESFWFGERRGFCEHYASAMTFILRAAGIPARIVAGYQGGNYIESGDFIQVRQMEAHAWVEAWIAGRWQRFDPTAAVAPGRVEVNLDDFLNENQPSDLPLSSRVGRLGLINRMSMFWDVVQYRWQVSVLDYRSARALAWFEAAFGRASALKLAIGALLVLGAVALVTALALGMVRWPVRLAEPYRSLRRIEARYGKRQPGETLVQYFERLQADYPQQPTFNQLSLLIERSVYTAQPIDKSALRAALGTLLARRRRPLV